MLIVHVTNTDPAGSVFNFVRAMNQHTPHTVRSIVTQTIPQFDFPRDIHDLYDRGDEIDALLTKSDVIHLHKVNEDFSFEFDLANGKRRFEIKKYLEDHPSKKVVYHLHGAPSERNFIKETAEKFQRNRAPLLVATPDLEEIYKPFHPNVKYWPNLVPIHDVRYLPRATDEPITGDDGETKRYCVFQSGTHSILKNMHVIREVMDKLMKELPVFFLHTSPESIVPLDTALRHKRISHAVFDHMEGYYGLSSLEGMSMGKPTIAGLSTYTVGAICDFFGTNARKLPWVQAENETMLENAIRQLFTNHSWRLERGLESRKFMEEVWSDVIVAQRMAAFYQSL